MLSINEMIKKMTETNYTVEKIAGCTVVRGEIPAREIVMLMADCGADAVASSHLADLIGATLVVGSPKDIGAMELMDLPICPIREAQAKAAAQLWGNSGLVEWLRKGRRGGSSNAMCRAIFGFPSESRSVHPTSLADVERCIGFLVATQGRSQLHRVAKLSDPWARLVSNWDELERLSSDERQGRGRQGSVRDFIKVITTQQPREHETNRAR